ncbi:hypothetical protein COU57_06850 [Candidatus Pacearchaeota archaeon CG10_big_fil_rev_8_21_14_0_10_32_14]|nr:hypothetical protein [Candidatus Pacearchaeota archaeon]PIN88943.1 MAG: hypothetical protein COU57_06850 [Candidatus Pacearchaeota archaeon CG10_big_fil_rev_8_21_14_0_10_32_14]
MVSLKWCCKQKDGIKLIEPSDNLSLSYMQMADNALGTMNRERKYNLTFAISAGYYSMYYSLYSVLMKLGVKCEIHSCTLEFMKVLLSEFYTKEDFKIISKAFDLRNIAQYYVDKVIDTKESDMIMSKAPLFVNTSKDVLSKINESDVKKIRDSLKGLSG